MMVYHVTPSANLDSIDSQGIDPNWAESDYKRSWFVTASRLKWAVHHVCKRHDVLPCEVAVLMVQVPRELLTRYARGVYSCRVLVPVHSVAFSFVPELCGTC